MSSVGEEICGDYLKYILNCDFVSYNVTNPDIQGEIDVVGIDLKKKIIYICEVATHTGGLQYVKDRRPNDYNKLLSKFKKDIGYAKKYFKTTGNGATSFKSLNYAGLDEGVDKSTSLTMERY